MAKSFTVTFGGSPAALVKKAQTAAQEAGAEFDGDTASGHFKGKGVVGHYTIDGSKVTVTITKEPLLAPWHLVESRIRKFFA